MKQFLCYLLLIGLAWACNKTRDFYNLVEGTWHHEETSRSGRILILQNGSYKLIEMNSDVIHISNGQYFINTNPDRSALLTLTLLPDLQFNGGDTIMVAGENIDIVSLTDSIIIVQKPTHWIQQLSEVREAINTKVIYRKLYKWPYTN